MRVLLDGFSQLALVQTAATFDIRYVDQRQNTPCDFKHVRDRNSISAPSVSACDQHRISSEDLQIADEERVHGCSSIDD